MSRCTGREETKYWCFGAVFTGVFLLVVVLLFILLMTPPLVVFAINQAMPTLSVLCIDYSLRAD